MVTPEALIAQAAELHEASRARHQRLPIADTVIVAEAPTYSPRGPTVLVLMRSTRARTDRRGRPLPATFFLQGATVGPDGRRDSCTAGLTIPGENLPLVAEMFARAMEIELAAAERCNTTEGVDATPAVGTDR